MKILLVSHFFPPEHTAGAEKRTLGYALGLKKLGYEVQVVCAGKWDTGAEHWNGFLDETYLDVPVRRINLNWIKAPDPNRFLYDNPVIEAHFEGWLKEWNPDLVHIISLITLSTSVIRAVNKSNLPLVFTLTDFWLICPKISLVRGNGTLCDGRTTSWDCLQCQMWNTRVYRTLISILPKQKVASTLKWMSEQPGINRLRGLRGMALDMDDRKKRVRDNVQPVDIFTAPSEFLGSVMEKGLGKPVQIIRSGHDLSGMGMVPKKSGTGVLRLGYIGQIIPVKGVHLLISAFLSAAAGSPTQLFIYGDPDYDPDFTRSLKVIIGSNDSIQWMGAFPHSQLGEVLSGLDMLIVPSQWHENNPRVIQEAFASKTPVIASNVGGISEFVQHDVNGLLFEYSSVSSLEEQIQRVIADPGIIQRLQAGIYPVKTNAEEIKELVELYQKLLDRKSRTRK